MESKTAEEAIKSESDVLAKAMTGKVPESEAPTESPIDEVRRLNRETKEMLTLLNKTTENFERTIAEAQLGGRAVAGQPQRELTPEEQDKERAAKVVKAFWGK